jgi:hypothetical protein
MYTNSLKRIRTSFNSNMCVPVGLFASTIEYVLGIIGGGVWAWSEEAVRDILKTIPSVRLLETVC